MKSKSIIAAAALAIFLSACAMPQTKEGQGTAWGAGIGAGLGALTGARTPEQLGLWLHPA